MVTAGLRRLMTPEIMDSAELDEGEHRRAAGGLKRLNKSAGAGRAMAKELLHWIHIKGVKRVRVMDVACGGGDVPAEYAGRLKESGVEVELVLLDRSSVAVDQAAEAARSVGVA